jgi:hypothetical protein
MRLSATGDASAISPSMSLRSDACWSNGTLQNVAVHSLGHEHTHCNGSSLVNSKANVFFLICSSITSSAKRPIAALTRAIEHLCARAIA